MQLDYTLDTLLALDGSIVRLEGGFWWKIEAKAIEPNEFIPHGIRYSLTLHDKTNHRIMGFDNSHAVRPSSNFKYAGRCLPYDHKHRTASDKGVPYEFQNAAQLLSDFWAEVDRVIALQK